MADTAGGGWAARPVFVSSTFRDMQAERDHLREFVWPELEELLRARRRFLEPVDLRQGVDVGRFADEGAREVQVLKVCLDEVERSRPFLIVLLGDRYGWVPPADRVEAAAAAAGLPGPVAGKSVTALEIEFGLLAADSAQRRRTFFYFRDPLPYDRMTPAQAAVYDDRRATLPDGRPDPDGPRRHAALEALKARLSSDPSVRGHVRTYAAAWDEARGAVTGLDGPFRAQVLADLRAALDEETRVEDRAAPVRWEDEEQATLDEFVAVRGRDVVGRERVIERCRRAATEPTAEGASPGLCVTGAPGSGKSALFARLHEALTADRSVLVLAHAAGISPRASSVDAMLRRFVGTLAAAVGEREPLAEGARPDDVVAAFRSLLSRASEGERGRRVVVLVDALDQFEPSPAGLHATWWPRPWPRNARFVATAVPGPPTEALAAHGVRLEPLPALSEADAREAAVRVGRRYRSSLPEGALVVLLAQRDGGEPSFGNPLWWTMAVETLNLLDADDFARAERAYAGRPDERLAALKADVARALPGDVPGLYAALLARVEAVHGVAPSRAFAVALAASRFGLREADLLALVPSLAPIVDPGAAVPTFDALRLSQLRRAFRAHLVRRGDGSRWDFFHRQARAAIERRHLSDDATRRAVHEALAEHLAGLRRDDPLRASETMHHLLHAGDAARAGGWLGSDLTVGEASGAAFATVAFLGNGEDASRVGFVCGLPGSVTDMDAACRATQRLLYRVLDSVTDTHALALRERLARTCAAHLVRLITQDQTNVGWRRDLSMCHERIGRVLMSRGDGAGALRAYRESLEISMRLARADPTSARLQSDLAVGYSQVGDILAGQGDLDEALRAYRTGRGILKALVREGAVDASLRRELAATDGRIADVLLEQGDSAGALDTYRAGLEVFEQLVREDPADTGRWRDLSVSQERVGDVLLGQGDTDGALRAYRASLQVRDRLAKRDPMHAGWQRYLSVSHSRVGDALLGQEDVSGALRAFQTGFEILDQLAKSDPADAGLQRDLSVSHNKIGDALLRLRDAEGALHEYRTGLEITDRLVKQDPTNGDWQRGLAASYQRLAIFWRTMHDEPRCRDALLRCREVIRGMVARRMDLGPSLRRLLQQLEEAP